MICGSIHQSRFESILVENCFHTELKYKLNYSLKSLPTKNVFWFLNEVKFTTLIIHYETEELKIHHFIFTTFLFLTTKFDLTENTQIIEGIFFSPLYVLKVLWIS